MLATRPSPPPPPPPPRGDFNTDEVRSNSISNPSALEQWTSRVSLLPLPIYSPHSVTSKVSYPTLEMPPSPFPLFPFLLRPPLSLAAEMSPLWPCWGVTGQEEFSDYAQDVTRSYHYLYVFSGGQKVWVFVSEGRRIVVVLTLFICRNYFDCLFVWFVFAISKKEEGKWNNYHAIC